MSSYKILQHDNDIDFEITYGDNDGKLIMLPNAPLHIIDHGSLVYLILLQIRLYDQQDFLPLTTPYESSAETNDIQHDTLIYNNPSLFNNDDNNNDNYYGDIPVSNSFIITLKTIILRVAFQKSKDFRYYPYDVGAIILQ